MQAHSPHHDATHRSQANSSHSGRMAKGGHYERFAIMLVLSFVCMYALMYAMVDRLSNVLPNFNQFYMAGLMTAPMAILELLLMGSMYPDRRKNVVIFVAVIVALVAFWLAIRMQVAIDDRQFLKSMVPHHAGAILMCEEAKVSDPEIKALCQNIVKGQQREIDQMKAILARL